MQENNFEKQVQKKIEELQLHPSAEVWQKVELEIRQDKRRRVGFWFLLLGLLLLSGGVYWWTSKADKTNRIVSINQHQSIPSKQNGLKESANENKVVENEKSIGLTENILVTDKRKRIKAISFISSKINTQPTGITVKRKKTTKQKITTTVSNVDTDEMVKGEEEQNGAATFDSIINIEGKINNDPIKINDSLLAKTEKKEINKNVIVSKGDSASTKKKKSKWSFAVQAAAGIAATGKGYFGNNNSYYDVAPPLTSGGSVTPTGPQYSNSVYFSRISSSLAGKLGISATYALSKKWSIVTGVTYKLYTTTMKTGNSEDSAGFTVYKTGSNKTYRNSYQFIDIPIEFQFRVGNNDKLSMHAIAGISLSKLVATNTLQFDPARNGGNGLYYPDNSLLNNTGVGITAAYLFDLIYGKKIALQLGPDFYYGLSTVAKTGMYANSHYSFIGVRVQTQIGKK
ncbi:outer membrane beta-barrel protein [Ferruginibacter albus]|uniref:outer membrane beta-barrel protein n=1 Tax=Ferruginibacter albus TaxID=2875540 RepID=UPI001CC5FBE7|nr:outer membrane beta-barrel protein [Ferruginibacter albus]UAY51437.1 PorT family protein [Ferruginibacter albus]